VSSNDFDLTNATGGVPTLTETAPHEDFINKTSETGNAINK
jgi:hypothetical protein